jgi:hypothetical protein
MPEVFSAKSGAMHQHPRASAFDNERASLHGWQDRVRDPSLTVLLVLQVFLLFVALPLAAVGVPIAELVAWLVLLVALTFVVVLSRRGVAIVKRTVIDGPFPELGELIAGFRMFLVNSKEEAIEWVKRCRILFVAASTRSKSAGSLRHRI